ncbi:MAG: hypothetical protein ACI8X5_003043 [Planctomycetota bacterium]|jgi:hypothetical protein
MNEEGQLLGYRFPFDMTAMQRNSVRQILGGFSFVAPAGEQIQWERIQAEATGLQRVEYHAGGSDLEHALVERSLREYLTFSSFGENVPVHHEPSQQLVEAVVDCVAALSPDEEWNAMEERRLLLLGVLAGRGGLVDGSLAIETLAGLQDLAAASGNLHTWLQGVGNTGLPEAFELASLYARVERVRFERQLPRGFISSTRQRVASFL